MKTRVIVMTAILSFVFSSCSSRKLERDYKVVDSSHQNVPEWVEDLDEWIDDEEKTSKKFRYYIYTTEPKNSRSVACEIANARSTSMIAAEVSTFIKHSFAQSKHGDPTKTNEALAEYVEEDLAKEVQAFIVGAQAYKSYWEKRRFDKELGSKKNWDGFTCTSLIKIPKKNLKKAFSRTEAKLAKKTSNAKARNKVMKIMKEATEAYTKM